MMAQRPAVVPDGLLILRPVHQQEAMEAFDLAEHFHNFFAQLWGATAAFLFPHRTDEDRVLRFILSKNTERIQALHFTGVPWKQLLPAPAATVLVRRFDGSLGMIQLSVMDVAAKADAHSIARQANELGEKVPLDAFGAISHLIIQGKSITDCRSGLIVPAKPSTEEFRAAVLAGLPLPQEVAAVLREDVDV